MNMLESHDMLWEDKHEGSRVVYCGVMNVRAVGWHVVVY